MASLAKSITKIGNNTNLPRVLGVVRDLAVAGVLGVDAGTGPLAYRSHP